MVIVDDHDQINIVKIIHYLEKSISFKTFILIHSSMNVYSWEILFLKEIGKGYTPLYRLDENDHLKHKNILKVEIILVIT